MELGSIVQVLAICSFFCVFPFFRRLLVGAPLSNVTSLSSSETFVNYGAIFKCEYKPGSKECTEILLDNQRKSAF